MGYSANLTETDFVIKYENIVQAFNAAKMFLMNYDKDINYVEKEDIESAQNIEDLFEVFGFEIEINLFADLSNIDFVWEKLGEEIILLNLIAPYVEEGSYLQWNGEDGSTWRHVFKDGKVEVVEPKIEW